MDDLDQIKEQHFGELIKLRQRISELEASETRRKRTDESLQESEERFCSLVQSASDAIITIDCYGKIISWNSVIKVYQTNQKEGLRTYHQVQKTH
jgi:PAS domain-containing protein